MESYSCRAQSVLFVKVTKMIVLHRVLIGKGDVMFENRVCLQGLFCDATHIIINTSGVCHEC